MLRQTRCWYFRSNAFFSSHFCCIPLSVSSKYPHWARENNFFNWKRGKKWIGFKNTLSPQRHKRKMWSAQADYIARIIWASTLQFFYLLKLFRLLMVQVETFYRISSKGVACCRFHMETTSQRCFSGALAINISNRKHCANAMCNCSLFLATRNSESLLTKKLAALHYYHPTVKLLLWFCRVCLMVLI